MRALLVSAMAMPSHGFAKNFAADVLAPRFFKWFASSEGVAEIHRAHVEGPTVRHMLKGTVLADAPDAAKLDFAKSSAGAAVASFMKLEQEHIGTWKVERIIEAAGADFDAAAARESLERESSRARVVIFSFVDCPWCLLAKERLNAMALSESEPLLDVQDVTVVELEDLGREGKTLRAAVAQATGRTSMPSVWVDGRCIGGFTDGDMPGGEEGLCVPESPGLEELSNGDGLRRLLEREREREAPAAAVAASRSRPLTMLAGKDTNEWQSRIFSPENAGPWAILIVVLLFEGLALADRLLPPDSLPPFVQQIIPLVLGSQYAPPPAP